MTVFRPHELEVVRRLAGGQLPPAVLEDVIAGASFVELEETGCGYYLTVRHAALPIGRVVCDKPLLHGQAGDVACGFVLFLENGLLTLECHWWGGQPIPPGFRDCDVVVS